MGGSRWVDERVLRVDLERDVEGPFGDEGAVEIEIESFLGQGPVAERNGRESVLHHQESGLSRKGRVRQRAVRPDDVQPADRLLLAGLTVRVVARQAHSHDRVVLRDARPVGGALQRHALIDLRNHHQARDVEEADPGPAGIVGVYDEHIERPFPEGLETRDPRRDRVVVDDRGRARGQAADHDARARLEVAPLDRDVYRVVLQAGGTRVRHHARADRGHLRGARVVLDVVRRERRRAVIAGSRVGGPEHAALHLEDPDRLPLRGRPEVQRVKRAAPSQRDVESGTRGCLVVLVVEVARRIERVRREPHLCLRQVIGSQRARLYVERGGHGGRERCREVDGACLARQVEGAHQRPWVEGQVDRPGGAETLGRCGHGHGNADGRRPDQLGRVDGLGAGGCRGDEELCSDEQARVPHPRPPSVTRRCLRCGSTRTQERRDFDEIASLGRRSDSGRTVSRIR